MSFLLLLFAFFVFFAFRLDVGLFWIILVGRQVIFGFGNSTFRAWRKALESRMALRRNISRVILSDTFDYGTWNL